MKRYILTTIDDDIIKDKRFFNGKSKKFLGNKAIQITEQQIQWTIKLLDATKDVIDCKTYRNKLKEILK